MTCEIAVMNKFGLALAADSASTVGDGRKIYHHAQKLFALPSGAPVGILIYGSAELMGVPWELIVADYARELGTRRFDRLEQYAEEFFRTVEGAAGLFPPDLQRDYFRAQLERCWKRELAQPLVHRLTSANSASPRAADRVLLELLEKDRAEWEAIPPLDGFDTGFAERVMAEYEALFAALEAELFAGHELRTEAKRALKERAHLMLTRQWIDPDFYSGVVFAGMGEAEPFPAVRDFAVGPLVCSRLRRYFANEGEVTRDDPAIVAPFAQSDMVDTFYEGLVPDLKERLGGIVARAVAQAPAKDGDKLPPEHIERIVHAFRKSLAAEIDGHCQKPLMEALAALPRHDLARIAESLVSLTALRRRMSMAEKETVGGAIDVAILSKANGFQWVKRGGRAPAPL